MRCSLQTHLLSKKKRKLNHKIKKKIMACLIAKNYLHLLNYKSEKKKLKVICSFYI